MLFLAANLHAAATGLQPAAAGGAGIGLGVAPGMEGLGGVVEVQVPPPQPLQPLPGAAAVFLGGLRCAKHTV